MIVVVDGFPGEISFIAAPTDGAGVFFFQKKGQTGDRFVLLKEKNTVEMVEKNTCLLGKLGRRPRFA